MGVVFVSDLVEVPRRAICIFSAHGVSVATEMRARTLGLRMIDGTCPLVSSVHRMVEKYHQKVLMSSLSGIIIIRRLKGQQVVPVEMCM